LLVSHVAKGVKVKATLMADAATPNNENGAEGLTPFAADAPTVRDYLFI